MGHRQKRHMAYICKLMRNNYQPPPPFQGVAEWFHYVFATTELKSLCSTSSEQ